MLDAWISPGPRIAVRDGVLVRTTAQSTLKCGAK